MPFFQDLPYAARQLRKNPWFSLAVIATLALTVGLSATVFSVVDAVLIRPLPYTQPDRLYSLATHAPEGYTQPASYPEYLDWRRDNHSFSALAAYNAATSVNFEAPGGPVALSSVAGTDNFFDVFAVKPLLGRTFMAGEDLPGRNFVTVLSYEVWQKFFSGSPQALGAKVKINGHPYTVIGVMPAGFRFPISRLNAVYIPLSMTEQQREGRGNHWLPTVGRLKNGISPTEAQADFNRVLADLGRTYPDTMGRKAKLVDLLTFTVGNASAALRLLIYAVLVMVAIGCVNVAGLLLARGVRLQREIAVRSALGAAQSRLIAQTLSESVLYAVFGAAAGVALAYGLLWATRLLLVNSLQRGADITLNGEVLAMASFVAVLTSLLSGLVPALRLSRPSAAPLLRSGIRIGMDREQHRLRTAFVITQFALALVLVVTSGLLLRALSGLRGGEMGFDPDGILTAEIDLSAGRYANLDVYTDFYRPLLERVQAIPGVRAAGFIQLIPIQSYGWNSDIEIVGQPPPPPNREHLAEFRLVTPGYFAAFGQQLIKGRLLDEKLDTPNSARVVVVNEAFVNKFIPAGQDPIGMQLKDDDARITIVGVVRNLRQSIYQPALAETDYPISQIPPNLRTALLSFTHLAIRTERNPESIIGALRRVMQEVDPTVPFRTPATMRSVIAESLTFERLQNWLFGTFAALSALLVIIGLYGLLSHEIEASTRDIGVRMALGANRLHILSWVYRRVGFMLAAGLLIGLGLTWMSGQLISAVASIRLENEAVPVLFLTAALAAAALLASFVPARRAAAVEPMESLRAE
jgi:putative ABC transport system permease protein